MRKVAFIAGNELVPWGGSESCWAAAAERLAGGGAHVSVSAMAWNPPVKQIEHLRSAGCRIFERPRRTMAASIRRRLHFLKRQEWSHLRRVAEGAELVVISQGGNTDGLLWMEAARSQGMKYAVISQSANEQWWPDDATAERLAVAYEQARAAYFVSQANLTMTRSQLATPLGRAQVIRNPFNVRYDARPAWPGDAIDELRVACVAALDVRQKGQNILIEVLGGPRWRERKIHLTFVGTGPHEQLLRKSAHALNLASVEFAGFVDDIEALWAQNHALVMASRFEGLPLALVEAMLCARAAIVTDVGGNRELVCDGVNGFLARAATADLLDEELDRAWNDRQRLREMGEAAARDIRRAVPPDPTGDFVRRLEAL